MASFDDDDDNGAGGSAYLIGPDLLNYLTRYSGSPDTSSENDGDEMMEDVDDVDGDDNGDGDGDDGDNDDDEGDGEGDNDDDEDQDEPDESPSQAQRSRNSLPNGMPTTPRQLRPSQNPTVTFTSPSPRAAAASSGTGLPFRPALRPEALTASVYDIVPTIAAPHSTSINAITATPDMRWVFSGGTDGYIRKFNWVDTANGKLALTVAQRHPFVDSVTKAGVLLSYWENEDGTGEQVRFITVA